MKKCKDCHGFTLVELMISLVLGLLVVAAAIQLFTTIKNTYSSVTSINARQEVLRFLSDSISQDVRMAFYINQPQPDSDSSSGYSPSFSDCGSNLVNNVVADGAPPFDSAPFGPTSWDDKQASALFISYIDEEGRSLRSDDPYCASGDLQEVRYFSVVDSDGSNLSVCFKCTDSTSSGLQKLQDGVRVSFHVISPEDSMYSLGILETPPNSSFSGDLPVDRILGVKVMFEDDDLFGQRSADRFFSFHVTPRNAVVQRELFGN
ncbi:MAG: PilW family protein [Pseudomonadota bacterium]